MRKLIWIFLLFVVGSSLFGYEFVFDFLEGDQYRMVSSSVQTAYINHQRVAIYDQGYKAVLRVEKAGKDFGQIRGKYYYMVRPYGEKSSYKVLEDKIYESDFTKYSDGQIKIGPKYFYPVVRNLPVFPKTDIKVGDTWKGTGQEAQDFTKIGIPDPFVVPFTVRYKYEKDEVVEGKEMARIEVFYHMNQTFAQNSARARLDNYPLRVMGFFDGYIYWDKKAKEMASYGGDYNFIYLMSNGEIREWKGKDEGEMVKIRQDIKAEADIRKEAKEEIKLAEIKEDKEGIRLIFSDILFDFNKTEIKDEIIPTLDKVVDILKKYPKYEVRVEGHSDNIGQARFKNAIAENRAQAVANYLIKKGISERRLSYMGFSDSKPMVPNTSDVNRAKNRRVEIYIITK